MKRFFAILHILFLQTAGHSQVFTVKSGEEIKLKRNKSIPALIGVDENGIYLCNYRQKRKYMTSDYNDNIYSLIKFDKKNNELFDYEYEDNLKGSEVSNFILMKENLYMFSYSFDKREKKYTVFGCTLNKETGKMNGALNELQTIELDGKKDQVQLKVIPNDDSSKIIISITAIEKDAQSFHINILSKELKSLQKVSFTENKEPELFRIKEIVPTDNLIILSSKNYEYQNPAKKRKVVFKDFSITAFNTKGEKVYNINPGGESKFIVHNKISLYKNSVLITGLFSNKPDKKAVNGIFVDRFDASTGKQLSSSVNNLSSAMFQHEEEGKTNTGTTKKNEEEEDEGITKKLVIRDVIMNPVTNSATIIAEIFSLAIFRYTSSFGTGAQRRVDFASDLRFTNADILIISTNTNFEITHVVNFPKKQIQRYSLPGWYNDDEATEGLSTSLSGRSIDFYSSFKSFFYKDKLMFMFNDNPANGSVKKSTDKPKPADDMRNTNLVSVVYDPVSGTFTRKVVLSNFEKPIPMIKESRMIGNEIFIYGVRPHFLAKGEFQIFNLKVK